MLFKRIAHWFLREEHRHRHFQFTVTLGVLISTAIGYFMPYHGELAIAAGIATNLVWIWER